MLAFAGGGLRKICPGGAGSGAPGDGGGCALGSVSAVAATSVVRGVEGCFATGMSGLQSGWRR
jgi:hypothetical protein